MEKRCVICDEIYYPQVDRYDNVTCSIACRSKLHREQRKAGLNTTNEQRMMLWLEVNSPDVAHKLNKIKAVYGEIAFNLACNALHNLGSHIQKRNK